MKHFLIGDLNWQSLPHEWFTLGGTVSFIALGVIVSIYLTKTKRWGWLWHDWLTSVDPKKIGIMYFVLGGLMLIRGGIEPLMIWLHQALVPDGHGFLSASHFQQLATAHGNVMVFFVAMAFIFGLINIIVPLQIGARDLASPFLNTLGFWLYAAGVVMVNMFFVLGGQYAATGWLAIAPLSGPMFSPGSGVNYLIWSLQISGIGTTLGAINFIMTILKMKAPGMKLRNMPLFTWGSLCSMMMALVIFPILTATLFLLFFDRSLGTHFFTITAGGNQMMYSNLIWMWGHPEVYVLVLPAFGAFSEVVSTFARRRVASYWSNVVGMIGVSTFALLVWLHHFYTMGAGADINAFFGLMTMFIAVPTAALVLNWIATLFRAKIRYSTPMLWFLGFAFIFTIGGLTGVMLAMPPIDYQVHNTLFLVAHFHSTVIGGVLFGIFAGLNYWWPKITGFRLNERIGRYSFWCWFSGFILAFTPLFILGLMGAPRRLDHYSASTGWQPFFIVSFIGGVVICAGVALQIIQIIASFIQKDKLLDITGDPWDARTLEWSVPSPAPSYNFSALPIVNGHDAFWDMKQRGDTAPRYESFEVPKNTGYGIYMSIAAFFIGFGFVWNIVWMPIIAGVAMIVLIIVRTFDDDTEYKITQAKVETLDKAVREKLPKDYKPMDPADDMGLIEFVKISTTWLLGLLKGKRGRV